MGQFSDMLLPQVPSLLEALQDAGTPVPKHLLHGVEQLKEKIQVALQVEEDQLEENLEALFPELWQLRLATLPFLANLEITEGLHKIGIDLQSVSAHVPQLKATVERLQFGIELMAKFVQKLLEGDPYLLWKITESTANQVFDYDAMMAQICLTEKNQNTLTSDFLHSSLMIELLLFALHQIAEGYSTPETAMYYELEYLSAEAIKQYAAGLGIDQTQLPWYQSPLSDFQDFLLAGPVANAEQLQFIKEKRTHFNTWM
jgi:hypothetical protein